MFEDLSTLKGGIPTWLEEKTSRLFYWLLMQCRKWYGRVRPLRHA